MSNNKGVWEFKPTSSALSWKYSRSSSVAIGHRKITPALYSTMDTPFPTYLPEAWSVYTNPEGNTYFARGKSPRIVTEANLHDSTVLRQILEVMEAIETKLMGFKSAMSESTEIFLELEDEETCLYYLVDHALRVQFWLEEVSTGDLGMRPSASHEHARLDLEKLYWLHVEYFPAHDSHGLNLAIDELTDIMINGRTDQMTSTTSTFPYSAEECAQFVQSLQTLRASNRPLSAHAKWSIARMWQNVADQRFVTHYGLKHARVASNISILDVDVPSETLLFKACDILGFRTPQTYLRLLNEQWVDELVNSQRWKSFILACQAEWMMSLILSFAILISNLLLVSSPIASSKVVAIPAVLLCNAAVGMAVFLFLQHGPMSSMDNACDISWFLSNADSKRFGLQLTAITFSLPRILTLWALMVSSMHIVVVTLGLPLAAICVGGVIAIVFLASLCFRIAGAASSWCNDNNSIWQRMRACLNRTQTRPEQPSV